MARYTRHAGPALAMIAAPLAFLNVFGGVASGIWLAVLGEWWAFGYIILGVAYVTVVPFVIAPAGILLRASIAVLSERGGPLTRPLFFVGTAYVHAITTAWCLFILYFIMRKAGIDTFWPLLIWSYSAALSPLSYLAIKERVAGGDASSITLSAQLAYVITALVLVVRGSPFMELAMTFSVVMLIAAFLEAMIADLPAGTAKGGQ